MRKRVIFLFVFCFALLSCKKDNESPLIIATISSLRVSSSSGAEYININSKENWSAESSESWCTISPANGDASIKGTTLTFSENESFIPRECVVTITTGEYSLSQYNIRQSGEIVPIVTQKVYNLSNNTSEIEVEVINILEFEVYISHNWITRIKKDDLPKNKLKFNISKNESNYSRTGTIRIKHKGGVLEDKILIHQSK